MSRTGRRQWAAVRRVRESRTSAEQKPASPAPRISTIATRSAKRASGAAPTSAPRRRERRRERDRDRKPDEGATRRHLRLHALKRPPVNRGSGFPRSAGVRTPASFTLHSAGYANMVGAVREQGPSSPWPRSPSLPRRGLEPRPGGRGRARSRSRAARLPPAQAALPQRGRDARRGQDASAARTVRGAQIRRAQRKAEALSAKLCHTGDEFIYEITLLHRDGRLVHVQMEAGTGKLIARPPHEPHEPREPMTSDAT